MNSPKTEWLLGSIFSIIGAGFLILALFMINSDNEFKKTAIEHTAIISRIDERRDSDGDINHTAYVKYTIDGQRYEERLNYYSSGMHTGEEILIYYDPKLPNNIKSKSSFLFTLIFFPIFGLVFFLIGFSIIYRKLNKTKSHRNLLENGEMIYAEITDVIWNRSYKVNGQSPYKITCKWVDPSTGLFYFFKSENIWFNPQPIIDEKGINSLPVYIDKQNPKKYFVSIEELQKLVALT